MKPAADELFATAKDDECLVRWYRESDRLSDQSIEDQNVSGECYMPCTGRKEGRKRWERLPQRGVRGEGVSCAESRSTQCPPHPSKTLSGSVSLQARDSYTIKPTWTR
jgi:hypothetical protein